jgi:hypothetical protein
VRGEDSAEDLTDAHGDATLVDEEVSKEAAAAAAAAAGEESG